MKISVKHTIMNVKIKHIGIPILFGLICNGVFAQQAILSSGGGSTNGMLSYSFGLVAFHTYTSGNSFIAEGIQHPFELFSNGSEVPNTLEITDETTFAAGTEECFGAQQTITIAGGGNPVVVQSGATVRFIAGQSIQLLPGFHAQESSSVHAFITTDGSFCDLYPSPIIVQLPPDNEKSASENPSTEESADQPFQPHLKAYPNPCNRKFTLEINNFGKQTEIVVFNMLGMVAYRNKHNLNNKVELNLPFLERGVYNIRVNDELIVRSVKMIVL